MNTLDKRTHATIKNSAFGKYSDGGGLWLLNRDDGGTQWVLRVSVCGRRREKGFGGHDPIVKRGVSLKVAREEAIQWQALAR
ncbi:Arm DNA-binding domain-containing protein [uncultured Shimia sp.]|uniref:Arm DNA-binding domain-containing protein n=1 Tax=uncultured Shimia sp. TaxID=573152 RepID=UPI003422EFC1